MGAKNMHTKNLFCLRMNRHFYHSLGAMYDDRLWNIGKRNSPAGTNTHLFHLLIFGKTDTSELWVGKDSVRDSVVVNKQLCAFEDIFSGKRALASGGCLKSHGCTGNITDRKNIFVGSLKILIDDNSLPLVNFNASGIKTKPLRVWRFACRQKYFIGGNFFLRLADLIRNNFFIALFARAFYLNICFDSNSFFCKYLGEAVGECLFRVRKN